ncbi:hypothetical protein A7K95_08520 [Pediococcus parvulus]|uniref:Transposase n=1 Tax=Pediococcus parvulus TaxID=54062 RepID=A0ABX2UG16_9LACO|nr:hypothetical protein A7K95_08520 [Pediococcus parvulus]
MIFTFVLLLTATTKKLLSKMDNRHPRPTTVLLNYLKLFRDRPFDRPLMVKKQYRTKKKK